MRFLRNKRPQAADNELPALPELHDPNRIPLGRDSEGAPISIPWDDEALVVLGETRPLSGAGHVAMGIADWALRTGKTVRMFTYPGVKTLLANKHLESPHLTYTSIGVDEPDYTTLFANAMAEAGDEKTLWVIDPIQEVLLNDDGTYSDLLKWLTPIARSKNMKVLMIVKDLHAFPDHLLRAGRWQISLTRFGTQMLGADTHGTVRDLKGGTDRDFTPGILKPPTKKVA